MSHFLTPIIDNLQIIIEHGGYATLFIITILEGIPIIGSLVPGHTTVILSGFLSKLGILNLPAVLFLVISGALIGDIIGYFIGKKYGFVFLKRFGKYVFLKDEHIEKAKKIVNNHTGKAIILGRFNPFTRPLAPFIVGASDVHMRSFWFFDIIGVLIWAIGSIAIGYVFGASYHIAALYIGRFTLIAIIIGVLIIWGYRFINKQFRIFEKYELIALICNIFGLYIFFKTIQDALSDKVFMATLDIWINIFFSSHITSYWLSFMNIISDIFSPSVLSVIALIGIIYFLIKKQWKYATISFLSISGGLIINTFIKNIVMRARPLDAWIIETGYSFPSSHTVAVTIFFTLIIYTFSRKIKNLIWREIFITLSILDIILVGFSRIYLGVHWFSDVVAGIALGVFWTTLIILFIRYIGMFISKTNSEDSQFP
ncbi:MAG: bifunctional DedA family/phosphatase PAP2 family protein [Patescibacteria group bacterium]